MTIPRIYQACQLTENTVVELDSPAAHHLISVLRKKVAAEIILFNGQGGEFIAEIIAIETRQAKVKIKEFIDKNIEAPIDIHLGQVISRGEKMDYTLQKSVELGVNKITPLFSQRCGVKLNAQRIEKRMQHWQQIVISACEQSGRTIIPTNRCVHLRPG